MKSKNLLLGLAPWVLFSMIAERLGTGAVGFAALVACAGSLLLAVRGARTDGLKIIDAAGVATFGVIAAIGFSGGHHTQSLLVDYGRGGSALVLALIMLLSVVTVPFTEQYSRPAIDRRYWGSPVFRTLNRRISLLWAGLILAMAACHLASGAVAATGHGNQGNLLLNWVFPILLVLFGFRRTEQIAGTAGLGRRPEAEA